jgi:hypothetical protein
MPSIFGNWKNNRTTCSLKSFVINLIAGTIWLSLDKIPYNELSVDDLSFNKLSFDKIYFRPVNMAGLSIFLLLVCDAHKMGQLVNDFFSN